MKFTVIGGAGRTGSAIVDRLDQAGHDVTVMSRREINVGARIRSVAGSITNPAVVADAVGDTDGVVIVVESDDDGDGPNGPRRVHLDGVSNVLAATVATTKVVLVTQIYMTRPERLPGVGEVISARRDGENLLRTSGRPYVIVRPGWLTSGPAGPVRLEQGDTGDGTVSRANVAAICVAALTEPAVAGITVEAFDDPAGSDDYAGLLRNSHLDEQR